MVIGVDIGGSKICGVLWNGKRVLKSRQYKTPEKEKEFLEIIQKLILKLIDNSSPKPPPLKIRGGGGKERSLSLEGAELKIGIGVAGQVNGTTVVRATNISYFRNFNFRKVFQSMKESGGILLRVDNDAKTYARAEYAFGAGEDARSILVVTIGTGIGRAYGEGGKILNIERFEKEEIWEKKYQKLRDSKNDKVLAKFLAGKLLKLANNYNPEVLIIGGGVSTRKRFFQKLEKEFKNLGAKFKIRKSKLTKNAGAIGAAMLWE